MPIILLRHDLQGEIYLQFILFIGILKLVLTYNFSTRDEGSTSVGEKGRSALVCTENKNSSAQKKTNTTSN
jgi:hypothetical protein